PVVMLSAVLMLVIGLFTNNICRRYPVFWISPPGPVLSKAVGEPNETSGQRYSAARIDVDVADDERVTGIAMGSAGNSVVIEKGGVIIPEWLAIDEEDRLALDRVQRTLVHRMAERARA
ncbi:hypothetical protein HKX48_005084, partial [Thoreauomyces humboldtii]